MSTVASPAPPTRRRMLSGARWAGAGVLDQAVIALANAGNTLLAGVLLPRSRSSDLLLAAAVAYFAIGLNRAFVGDVLLALASRYDGARRERLVRDGLCSALVIGVGASLVLAILRLAVPPVGSINLRDLAWVAPFLPLILLHDTGRYIYLSARRPTRALAVDLIWVGSQATVVAGSILAFGPSAPGLLVAWGLGASAGFTAFCLRERIVVWRGSPRRWLAETRQLAGWFTATALVGQAQTLAVGFLTGGLSRTALSGLRIAQTVLLQPVQNFQLAVQGLLVPRLSRLAARVPEDPRAARDLRRQVRKIALAFTGLAGLLVAVLWPVASLVLTRIDKFADIAPLALPIALQAGIYLVQVPFTAALRGMHRAKVLFAQYAVFTTVSLTGLVIGARCGELTGAVWGLLVGSATGLVVMIGLYRSATASLR
ncbi:MAG: hypothetical protein HKP61_09420 [Dactylosporangium sp.]|nr:hypothetical protein [Dactylosporangium sp.]NNJ61151.1 hypothetical protein [Dactylosporangium sp.]